MSRSRGDTRVFSPVKLRDGAWIVIARTKSLLCPVAMLEWYMRMAEMAVPQDRCLPWLTLSLRRKADSVSYTRMRELVLEKLAALGLDTKQFAPSFWGSICCLKGMADGAAKTPKMAMRRTLSRRD